jgi:anti-sigma B factor antagonist
MQPAFAIDGHVHGDGHVLALKGELDIAGAPVLTELVSELCARRPAEIVLDLRELEFVDSTGLGSLLAAAETCRAQGIELSLTRGTRQVERLFELAGVRPRLPLRAEPIDLDAPRRRLWPLRPWPQHGEAPFTAQARGDAMQA